MPVRHQFIIWTNADILSIQPTGTFLNVISFEIEKFSFLKTHSDFFLRNGGDLGSVIKQTIRSYHSTKWVGVVWFPSGIDPNVDSWWRHQMETFSALLAICAGNSPISGEFPAQRPVTRSFGVFFDLCPISDWVNNREAGDLRRSRAHYDVIVMYPVKIQVAMITTSVNPLSTKDWTYHHRHFVINGDNIHRTKFCLLSFFSIVKQHSFKQKQKYR